MENYDEIINLPHYRSPHRTPMPMENRAAQFAPFAALAGHDEALSETSRLTARRIELTNEEKVKLSKQISSAFEIGKRVKVIYFVPDKAKTGGSYAAVYGIISKIDRIDRTILLDNGTLIPIDNICSVKL